MFALIFALYLVGKSDAFIERIPLGNELQDVNYLARGVVAARSVARVAIHGIEATAPFGAYKTFQVKTAEVERLTGLQFTSGGGADPVQPLSACDPLKKKKSITARLSIAAQESAGFDVPEGYVVLNELDDVYLDE
ncbi:MAG: hypothetical protein WA071_00185 [Undibacterium umbellatum]|uniref:hypothetical protein n=1 Tax=Undibacterium umbellatum TaxID=2762300 RepID=UPI003BB619DC